MWILKQQKRRQGSYDIANTARRGRRDVVWRWPDKLGVHPTPTAPQPHGQLRSHKDMTKLMTIMAGCGDVGGRASNHVVGRSQLQSRWF